MTANAATTTYNLNNQSDLSTLGSNSIASSDTAGFTPIIDPSSLTNTKSIVESNATNPTLPVGGSFSSTPIVSGASDTLQNNVNLAPLTPVNTATATASYADLPVQPDTKHYTAAQGVAAHGTVTAPSLVQNQFKYIMNDNTDANGVPQWASVPVAASNQKLNSLGLGASTMAAGAETGAILTAALPIAEQNAHTYALMNTQNVTNDQYTMLSNTSMKNASYQFNAKSDNQANQFFGSLTSTTKNANAASATGVSKYNAGQQNSVGEFNNKTQETRDEFNSSNQLVIDQSNVKWSRSINTANTASTNADNNANVKNTFNLSTTAVNDLWQQARDEGSWALTSSDSSKNRGLSLTNSSLNRQTSYGLLNSTLDASKYSQLGSFGVGLLGGTSGISSGIKSLIGSGTSASSAYYGSSASPTTTTSSYAAEGGFMGNPPVNSSIAPVINGASPSNVPNLSST